MSQKELDAMTDKVLAYDPNKPNGDSPLETIAGAADQPLVIGDIEIPCYVLEGETRVLTQRGVIAGIAASKGGARREEELGAQIPRFATQPFLNSDLTMVLKSPICFVLAYGYPATVLADICDAILEAEKQGKTTARQAGIVAKAKALLRGFARVGIVALVDEATGYEDIREERALSKILDLYIAKELQQWTKTFPMEFYEQICRLWGWPNIYSSTSVVGRITRCLRTLGTRRVERSPERIPYCPVAIAGTNIQWLTPDLDILHCRSI